MLALGAIAVASVFAYGVRGRPLYADDQLYYFISERSASGVPPHVSETEIKTQLSTLIYGASIAAGRTLGFDDVLSGRAAGVAAAALTTMLSYALALELTQSALAAVVAGIAALAIHGVFVEAATGFQPKLVMLPFLLLAQLWCARRRWLLCGIAAMCTFLCWQPGAVVLCACTAAVLIDRRSTWKSVAQLAAGAALALACFEAWFAWHGAIAAQVRQEFLLAFGADHKPIDWAESAWFYLTEAEGYEDTPHVLPTVFAIAAALLWIGILARPRRAMEIAREKPGLVAFWIAIHLGTAFTFYDHQAHPDMLLVQPYFVVGWGIAFGWVTALLWRSRAGRVAALAIVAIVAWWTHREVSADIARAASGRNLLPVQYEQARLVSLYYDHRGSVWALGPVHLLALLHQDNWAPVGDLGREGIDMATWRPLRRGRMPEIILLSRGFRPGNWLQSEYVDITPKLLAVERIRVFSRRIGGETGFDAGVAPRPFASPAMRPGFGPTAATVAAQNETPKPGPAVVPATPMPLPLPKKK
jgi:hypothetical protein